MDTKIIQNFKGVINGVGIDHQNIFGSTEYIIEQMEDHFDIDIDNTNFTKILSETIQEIYSKYDNFSFATLEEEFTECIKSAKAINDVQFNYCGEDWKMEILNDFMKTDFYSINLSNKNKKDKNEVLEIVKNQGWCLEDAVEFQDDKEVVLAAVKNYGGALGFAPKFHNNKEIVMAAVQNDGFALIWANEDLQNNKDIVMAAVQNDGIALKFANEKLQNDPEVVMVAVKNKEWMLSCASDEIKEEIKEAGGVDKWIKQQEEPSQKKRKPIDNKIEIDTDKQNEK